MDHSWIGSSHKRPSHLSSSPGDDRLCGVSCHYDHAREDAPGPKRPKYDSQIPRAVLFHTEDPLGYLNSSFNNAIGDSFDINPYSTDRVPFHALPSPSQLTYFNFGGQLFQQQNEGIAESIVGTSVSYTATDGTFSPRPLSSQELADTNEDPLPSSTPVLKEYFVNSEDFGARSSKEWWDGSFEGVDVPASPDSLWAKTLDESASGVEDTFADRHHENEFGEVDGLSFATSTYVLNESSNAPPWAPPVTGQSLDINTNIGEHSHNITMSAEIWQPTIPCVSKFKELQPFTEFSTTSSTLSGSISITGRPHSRPLFKGQSNQKLPKRPGIRTGPLSKSQAHDARIMRKHKACTSCRLSKTKCSPGTPCEPCTRLHTTPAQFLTLHSSPSLSTYGPCFRAPLAKYMDVMFPSFAILRFQNEKIADLVDKSARFTSNKILVEMSSRPDCSPITLTATEFRCLDAKIVTLDYVMPNQDTKSQCQKYTRSYAPPIGLYEVEFDELKTKCLAHISSIIGKKRHIEGARSGDISPITHEVFEAVNTYRRSIPGSDNSILTKAVKIFAMHDFMSGIIILTKNSAEVAVRGLRQPQQLPFDEALQVSEVLTSKLLDLQLKQAMLPLLQGLTIEVLNSFEKALMKHQDDSTSWTDNFCVMLVLCMCIEASQVSNDCIAMALLRKNPNSAYDRTEIFLKLENGPFRQLTSLFHTAYKTSRAKAPSSRKGFNPIRCGFPIGAGKNTTSQTRTLVSDIEKIMKRHDPELAKASQKPSFDNPKPDLLSHHMVFRKCNSGRLVSTFLKSFLQ